MLSASSTTNCEGDTRVSAPQRTHYQGGASSIQPTETASLRAVGYTSPRAHPEQQATGEEMGSSHKEWKPDIQLSSCWLYCRRRCLISFRMMIGHSGHQLSLLI